MRWMAMALALLATGACELPQETRDEIACTNVCRCFTASPATEEACLEQCLVEFAPVPPACAECIDLNADACDQLEEACDDACASPDPEPTARTTLACVISSTTTTTEATTDVAGGAQP